MCMTLRQDLPGRFTEADLRLYPDRGALRRGVRDAVQVLPPAHRRLSQPQRLAARCVPARCRRLLTRAGKHQPWTGDKQVVLAAQEGPTDLLELNATIVMCQMRLLGR